MNYGECLFECPQGYFDNGYRVCDKCFSQCLTCEGTAYQCTDCDYAGTLPFLLGDKCISDCPDDHVEMQGVCKKCESPCATCEGDTKTCNSCDGADGAKYRFGFECLNRCPAGTSTNLETSTCEGCRSGCDVCDFMNPKLCLRCNENYLTFKDECVSTCPTGSVMSFQGDSCLDLSEIDVRLVYFPFLIALVLIATLSCVGRIVKPNHLVLTNFVIMLGLLEHLSLLSQVVLTFIFGTYKLAIVILLIWLGYVGTLVVFNVIWHKNIVRDDLKYAVYQAHPDNRLSSVVRSVLAHVVSWRSQKLLYSHFFGAKVNSFAFSEGTRVMTLMWKTALANTTLTFVPLIVFNAYCLATGTLWGTQLQIIQIENIVIALVAITCTIIEHWSMKTAYRQF